MFILSRKIIGLILTIIASAETIKKDRIDSLTRNLQYNDYYYPSYNQYEQHRARMGQRQQYQQTYELAELFSQTFAGSISKGPNLTTMNEKQIERFEANMRSYVLSSILNDNLRDATDVRCHVIEQQIKLKTEDNLKFLKVIFALKWESIVPDSVIIKLERQDYFIEPFLHPSNPRSKLSQSCKRLNKAKILNCVKAANIQIFIPPIIDENTSLPTPAPTEKIIITSSPTKKTPSPTEKIPDKKQPSPSPPPPPEVKSDAPKEITLTPSKTFAPSKTWYPTISYSPTDSWWPTATPTGM